MQHALLREEVLAGFAHMPRSSIPVMSRMSRKITASHPEIAICVAQLTRDGLLQKVPRSNRLPPLYFLTPPGIELLRQEEYVILRDITLYEQNALEVAIKDEQTFAADQIKVMDFLARRNQNGHPLTSQLMIQDLLRTNTSVDNMLYTSTVLAQLGWNQEVEGMFDQEIWRFLRVATQHVWD